MSRDKQTEIEEMAKVIEQARIKATDTTNSMNYGFGGWYAKELYNAGYRKTSEVAREIFEEIEKEIEAAIESNYRAKNEHHEHSVIPIYDNFTSMCDGKIHAMRGLLDFIAELKKKYIGEDTNVVTNTEDGK